MQIGGGGGGGAPGNLTTIQDRFSSLDGGFRGQNPMKNIVLLTSRERINS